MNFFLKNGFLCCPLLWDDFLSSVSIVLALSEISSTSHWLCFGVVDVTCWRPMCVAFDSHALTQFFGLVKNVFPSNVVSGQRFVLSLIVEMSHFSDFFPCFCLEMKHWVSVLMISFSSCFNEQLSWSNVVFAVPGISANHGDNVGS